MSSLRVKNAAVLVTMDGTRREIPDGGMFVENGIITAVGPTDEMASSATQSVLGMSPERATSRPGLSHLSEWG